MQRGPCLTPCLRCVCPGFGLRDFVWQVSDHLRVFAQPAGIWVAPVVGGMSPAKQKRLLAKRPAVVVATPGRLWELVREGEVPPRHVP